MDIVDYISLERFEELTGIKKSVAYNWIRRKYISHAKIGKNVVISYQDYLKKCSNIDKK